MTGSEGSPQWERQGPRRLSKGKWCQLLHAPGPRGPRSAGWPGHTPARQAGRQAGCLEGPAGQAETTSVTHTAPGLPLGQAGARAVAPI